MPERRRERRTLRLLSRRGGRKGSEAGDDRAGEGSISDGGKSTRCELRFSGDELCGQFAAGWLSPHREEQKRYE